MAWEDEMVPVLRVMVDDAGAVPRLADDALATTLVVAARLVLLEVVFPAGYKANAEEVTITPDPTLGDRDEPFIDLVCLKAACVLNHGAAVSAAARAVLAEDGRTRFDAREAAKATRELLAKGWCAAYDQAKQDYLMGQTRGSGGLAILTPFRTAAARVGPRPGYWCR